MTIWKKALSVATSAALLASLLAATVAPGALASIAIAGVGTINQGGTSANTATFTFTENSAAALTATGSLVVTITPAAPGTGTVTFVGTPVISAPGSLGASVSAAGNVLSITLTGHDDFNVETIVVTGLKIQASSNASPGAIVATLSNPGVQPAVAFIGGTATATGKLSQAYGPTTTNWIVAVDSTSPCIFSGTNSVTVGGETLAVTSVSANNVPVVGQQTFVTAAMVNSHAANEIVTQSVPNCTPAVLPSPGTVAVALQYLAPTQLVVYPGETYADAGNLAFRETITADASTGTGYLAADNVITATITTAGVTFSQAPWATGTDDTTGTTSSLLFKGTPTNSNPARGIVSADKKSATWTIGTAYAGQDRITISEIQYDVASTVVGGTSISVAITVSGKNINPASRSNAVVNRPVTASATATTVYIGENGQTAGTISIVENAAGTFTDGTGNSNTFEVCLTTGERFSAAPSATVTAGNLNLRSGAAAVAPGTAVVGTPFTSGGNNACYYWTVWTASTTASTIQITTKLDVPTGLGVGNTIASVGIGSVADPNGITNAIKLKIATRVFRAQVAVTALSQPLIPLGSNGTLAGNIQIQETGAGQLKFNERICVDIVPNQNWNTIFDAYMTGLRTADVPVVEASNGLVVGAVTTSNVNCGGVGLTGNVTPPVGLVVSFSFVIEQQSVTGNGKLVISNIKYATANDAVEGPVQVNVYGDSGSNTQLQFQSLISNAKIGVKSAIAISAVTALGLIPNQGPWSTSTKVAAANKFITWKFDGGAALAGKTVRIYVAAKNSSGGWGPFVNLTGRVANAAGVAEFHWRSTNQWVSVRAYYAGDATYNASWSSPLQGRWL